MPSMPTLKDVSTLQTILFAAGVLVGSLVTQSLLPYTDWGSCRQVGIETEARATSACLPTLEQFASGQEESYRLVRVNGTYNRPSPFRGPPNHDVDRAWERYWKTWIFSVSDEEFVASLPEHPLAAVRSHDGSYIATFEATHQLHCLYNLFRASYLDHYADERAEYDNGPKKWHDRVDHCVEILRQKLECDRDTTLLTYNWVKGKQDPVLNFNAARLCPSWNSMDEWALRRRIDGVPTKPDGALELEMIP